MKISVRVSELLSGHDFRTEIFKGLNSLNNAGGVTVIVFCDLSVHVNSCTEFHGNIS